MLDEFELELDWVGFELNPGTPRGGRDVFEMFGAAQVVAVRAQLQEAAAGMGVQMGEPPRLPNTRRALALVEQARDAGTLAVARNALMDAHWLHARDIESDSVLSEIAERAGLDADLAVPNCDAPVWQARVDAMRAEAGRWGVTGIPTFFLLPEGWSVEGQADWRGPQPIKVFGSRSLPQLRQAARSVGARERSGA